MRILLVQPCYPHGRKQTYLPGGLLNLGSRLRAVGIQVDLVDYNQCDQTNPEVVTLYEQADIVGVSVLGTPYIPSVINHVWSMGHRYGFRHKILIGGEGVARIRKRDFINWFAGLNPNLHLIQSDHDLEVQLGLKIGSLPSMYDTSMVPMLADLPESQLEKYLCREFALFLSQGCKFNCNFCAAAKARAETYRSLESLREEVEFICRKLVSFRATELKCYLTNLDLLQTPTLLDESLSLVATIALDNGLKPAFRGLATSRCTVQAVRADATLLPRLKKNGLITIGFGADGASQETWERENKPHNNMWELVSSVLAVQRAGMTAEVLMVIAFDGDSVKALVRDVMFSFAQAMRGAVIRPYLGKSKTPSGRWPEGDAGVMEFRSDPRLLKNLDYTMLGSKSTHPHTLQRWFSNAIYLGIIVALTPFGKCTTPPLIPYSDDPLWNEMAEDINKLMPLDR
jgi:hypothetical protein